jgi:4-hydroxy-tetrahydrodipicolinate reductase
MQCLKAGVAVVSGTTGWNDRLEEVKNECNALGGGLFVASNFSIGMNIVFELNRQLARMTKGLPSYSVAIKETHHIHKLDAPSGTAIHLAEGIIAEQGGEWYLTGEQTSTDCTQIIPITAVREGEVAGIHEVRYDSPLDTITLTHEAKGREGLALGATLAAEFVVGKKGVFTMHDLIKN